MDKLKAELGATVIVIGFAVILVSLWLILGKFTDAEDVTAVLGPITTAIAGLGGTFFGVSLGQQGKEKAEQARDQAVQAKDKAQQRAELYLAQLPPEIGQQVQQSAEF